MEQTQKNRANDNCGGTAIGCQTEGVANSLAISGKEVKRMNRSKRNSRSCLVEHRPWSQRYGGFTLIELLVVIALIALMLGLLVPCLHAAKEKANQVKCMSNLQSLGMAVQMYTDQYEGLFPKVTDCNQVPLQVRQALQSYVSEEEIFLCPADPVKPTPPGGSYDWRLTHDPKISLANVPIHLIRNASSTAIGGERRSGWHKPKMINVIRGDFHVVQIDEKTWFEWIMKPVK
jgi:prepilin-type N-terminal cleavage/methylation domain-containing protein